MEVSVWDEKKPTQTNLQQCVLNTSILLRNKMIDEKNQQELIMLSKSMTSGDVFDSALDCIRCLLFTKIIYSRKITSLI